MNRRKGFTLALGIVIFFISFIALAISIVNLSTTGDFSPANMIVPAFMMFYAMIIIAISGTRTLFDKRKNKFKESDENTGFKFINSNEVNKNDKSSSNIRCPICNSFNSSSAKFCNSCGAKLEKNCSYCGTKNDHKAKYCSNCGHEL